MDKVKAYIYSVVGITIVILVVLLAIVIKDNKKLEEDWEIAMENCKTYDSQFGEAENTNRALKLTVDQLNTYNDSILQELNTTRKNLKIKDSNLQSLLYTSSTFTKTDTIILKDTIFRDPQVNIDTIISDEWYSIRVGLKYPSTIAMNPEFRSIKNILVHSKKETVNPPKKFFLFRWFQKKHYVLQIDVIEKNPYISTQNNRYIEIVK